MLSASTRFNLKKFFFFTICALLFISTHKNNGLQCVLKCRDKKVCEILDTLACDASHIDYRADGVPLWQRGAADRRGRLSVSRGAQAAGVAVHLAGESGARLRWTGLAQ